jgi:serine/threonine protein kinase
MLYEMLAGKPPFEADSLVDLIEQHLHAAPPRVSQQRPELPPQVDHVIERALAKEPTQRYLDALALASEFIQALGGDYQAQGEYVVPPSFEPANPYKGLRPFEEVDSADFFGREALTQQLLQRLEEKDAYHRFLAVVGPSGSGKSSAVKAELIPALRRGALPGSEKWYIAEMCPHSYPLDELEVALLRLSANNLKLAAAAARCAACCERPG